MQWYSQTSAPWAFQELGFNNDPNFTIGAYGCLVTSASNLLKAATGREVNPGQMNDWLKANGGFLAGSGILSWPALSRLGGLTTQGTASSLVDVNNFLVPAPNFALIEVKGSRAQHFVLGNLVGKIVDPEGGVQRAIGYYPFVAAHLYTATSTPTPATTPPPSPVIAGGGTLNAIATVRVSALNTRVEPTTDSPRGPLLHAGTVHVNEWRVGQSVTVDGRTDNVWLKTDGQHWFSQAGTNYHE